MCSFQKEDAVTEAEKRNDVYEEALKMCVQQEVVMTVQQTRDQYMQNVKRLGWFVTQRCVFVSRFRALQSTSRGVRVVRCTCVQSGV